MTSARASASLYRMGDRTVIRAAYGLFYFNEQGTGGSTRLFINYPFAAQYTVTCSSTIPCLRTSAGIPRGVECQQPSHRGVPAHRQSNAQRAAVASHGGAPVEFFDGRARRLRRQPWQSPESQHQRKCCDTGAWAGCSPPTISFLRRYFRLGAAWLLQL